MTDEVPSPDLFFATASAYERTFALRAAIELEMFTHVAAGQRTVGQIAEACNASLRGVRILLDYLTVLGFFTKDGDHYHNAPHAEAFLSRRSSAYVGAAIDYITSPALLECYETLTTAVRKGRTAASRGGILLPDNEIWVTFARGVGPAVRLSAGMLARLVTGERDRPLRVLDVAAGHGHYGIAIARRFPNAVITALDWANVLAVASENAVAADVAGRYHLIPGSALEVDWGGPYDVVLLVNFLHHFDAATNDRLVERAYRALSPGGQAIILEYLDAPSEPPTLEVAAFALNSLAATEAGDVYSLEDYEAMLARAGFPRSLRRSALAFPQQQALVTYKAVGE
ncbi:MAG: methyltransferase domain-containing protein [Deltaproteobacteria bacterium]|nr:methyltransferase domain-containing protein [Deltaproteobacteria bacterium]